MPFISVAFAVVVLSGTRPSAPNNLVRTPPREFESTDDIVNVASAEGAANGGMPLRVVGRRDVDILTAELATQPGTRAWENIPAIALCMPISSRAMLVMPCSSCTAASSNRPGISGVSSFRIGHSVVHLQPSPTRQASMWGGSGWWRYFAMLFPGVRSSSGEVRVNSPRGRKLLHARSSACPCGCAYRKSGMRWLDDSKPLIHENNEHGASLSCKGST